MLTYAFASSHSFALLFEILVLIYLFRRGQIELALPFVLLAVFLTFIYTAPWHLGLLWVVVLMALWAAWDESVTAAMPGPQNAVAVFLGVLCLLQLPWTFGALAYDARNPMSPDKDTAAFLHTLPPQTRIAGYGMSTGVQPYFEHNIFFNQPRTFGYLGRDQPGSTIEQGIAGHADIFVADPIQKTELEQAGFRQVRRFCGALYFPNRPINPECLLVFERPNLGLH